MPRPISERTRKVREIVNQIPPSELNKITPSHLSEKFKVAGVYPENDLHKQTIYAEFSRRRRRLGLSRSQVGSPSKFGSISAKERQAMKVSGIAIKRIVELVNNSDVSIFELLVFICKLDLPTIKILQKLSTKDFMLIKQVQQEYGITPIMQSAYALGLKEDES